MKNNKQFKVWMLGRVDQSLLVAEFLLKKKKLIKWDSFIRLSDKGLLRIFFKDSKRIMNSNMRKIPGNHFLPELVSRFLAFFGYKKGNHPSTKGTRFYFLESLLNNSFSAGAYF